MKEGRVGGGGGGGGSLRKMRHSQGEIERGRTTNFKWLHILLEMTDMRAGFVLARSPWHERRAAAFWGVTCVSQCFERRVPGV